jgi:hypothetical protein
MEGIVEKFVEHLPLPILGAIAFIVFLAWILKEARNFSGYGQVFGLRGFQIVSAVIFGGIAVYYGYIGYRQLYPSAEFERDVRGIVIFAIKRDQNGAIQDQIYQSIRSALDTNQFPADLRVKENLKHIDDQKEDDAGTYCREINATACAWGIFISDAIVYMNAVLSSDPKILARTQLRDYHKPDDFVQILLKLASNSLPDRAGDKIASQYVQDKLTSIEENQNRLTKEMLDLEQRLAALTTESDKNSILTQEKARRRIGLFIGNSRYSRLPQLRFSSADAQSMVQVAQRLWNKTDFTLLVDASRSAILDAMTKLDREAHSDDQVWVYFSGHTVVEKGESYFLPIDADPDNVLGSGIPFEQVRSWLDGLGSEQKAIFIDTCYSGAFLRHLPLGSEESTKWKPGKGTVVFTATGANELSFEDDRLGHGLFTYALLDGLQNGIGGRFGVITANSLFSYIRQKVLAQQVRGIRQSPAMYSSLQGDIALAPGNSRR